MASVSLSGYVEESAMYRAYSILSLIPPTVVTWFGILASKDKVFVPFSINGAVLAYSLLYFFLSAYLVGTFGKGRIKKVIIEIQQLDRELIFKDKTLLFKVMIHNIIWVVSIFHVTALGVYNMHYLIKIKYAYLTTTWLELIDIVMISEVACFSSFTILLYARLKYFATYLNILYENQEKEMELNVALCYRQIHRVLKRVDKAFRVQVVIVIAFNFYSCLRVFLVLTRDQNPTWVICFHIMMAIQFVSMFVFLGVLGQGVAVQLQRVRILANLMAYSPNDRLRSIGVQLSREAEVRSVGLTAMGRKLDARLPLRSVAAVVSALILLLQLGVSTDNPA